MAQKKVAGKKPAGNNNKRGPKAKQVEEEKPELEVEENEDSDASEEENDASDAEENGAAGLVDSEAEEDDDEDDDDEEDDDEDEDDDELEPGQISISKPAKEADEEEDDDDDSDDEPVEAPISKPAKEKEAAKKGGIPKIPLGPIPAQTPKEQIVYVSNIPNKYKHNELIALFTKFGPIKILNRIKSKTGGNNVSIAFETTEGAAAALAAKPKALTLNDEVLKVTPPLNKAELNERTVVVGLIGPSATKENLTDHFKSCGTINAINFSNNRVLPHAYIRFQDLEAAKKALKLDGSEFNSRFITVRSDTYGNKELKSPALTLTITNTGNHESYKTDAVEKIFKKHGTVKDVDVVCTRTILAFVTYETAEQAQKALKALNGKTVGDLEIKIEPYNYSSSARSVLVTNLIGGVNEEEIKALFNENDEVESVRMLVNKAIVKFTTDDAFCKSFLLNERIVKGQPIFLEPNSTLKHKILQKKQLSKPYFKNNKNNGGGAPGQYNKKFGNNNKPFNKRPAQENGSTPTIKKAKQF
ncbi:DNA-binding protein modulo [Drosophila nasuta]|uniref:DNA-binding protein modulo n=1 Tax=Drosophila nasuta TaxID=42062 RepID=UPI00295F067C|nr:DNA-binding protein modulo [Drosophila nasuta]